jgi:hypothetical protein
MGRKALEFVQKQISCTVKGNRIIEYKELGMPDLNTYIDYLAGNSKAVLDKKDAQFTQYKESVAAFLIELKDCSDIVGIKTRIDAYLSNAETKERDTTPEKEKG